MNIRFDSTGASGALSHVEHDFANRPSFYGVVRLSHRPVGEMRTGEMTQLPPSRSWVISCTAACLAASGMS